MLLKYLLTRVLICDNVKSSKVIERKSHGCKFAKKMLLDEDDEKLVEPNHRH